MPAQRDTRGRFAPSVAVSFRRHRTLDLYWQHYSREEIAAELNITLELVGAYIRQGRARGDRRAAPRLQKRVMAAQTRRAQIKEMAARGSPPHEIARAVHLSVKHVRLRLREAGIELKKRPQNNLPGPHKLDISTRRRSMTEEMLDGAYTIEGFCKQYGVGKTLFYEEVKEGRLVAKKLGQRTLIPRAEARRWFDNLPNMSLHGPV